MPESDLDPGASTQMFQAFVDRPEPEESARPWMRATLVGVGLVGTVIALAFGWLVLGG